MLPNEIEQESFRIIRSEMAPNHFSEDELSIVVRVIHATGDFEFADIMRFEPRAVTSAVDALKRGCMVVTDVEMVKAGINQNIVQHLNGKVICSIRDPEVAESARREQKTRSTLAIRKHADQMQNGIVAIGNAPTALLEVIRLVREETITPALIIGVPVGFVQAAESKDLLASLDIPYITALGRKGGSPIAAAIMNALLRIAVPQKKD